MATSNFVEQLGYNQHGFGELVKDINHALSVKKTPFAVNNFNWIVGHIIESRNELLEIIGGKAIWAEETRKLYKNGSEPIAEPENPGVDFETLKRDFGKSHEALSKSIQALSADALLKEIGEGERKSTIAAMVNGYL